MKFSTKIFKTLVVLITFYGFSFAQNDSLWTRKATLNVNLTNVGLSNWAAGGQNTLAIGGLFDGKITRTSERTTWENYLNVAYGITRLGDSDQLFKKTDDQLVLGSKYTYKFNNPKWGATAGLELRTQTQPGLAYGKDAQGKEYEAGILSEFFSPAYLTANLGISYTEKLYQFTLSPIASKVTFVMNESLSDAGAFGVDKGKNVRVEIGANFNGKLEVPITENINFKTALNLFANYENLDLIDVNWSTLLSMKINKYLSTTFGTELIYDHDVLIPQKDSAPKQAIQFKHVLNVNFGINF